MCTSSVFQGEALAVRLAGRLIEANQINEATIESDNKMVIHLCSMENVPPWESATIFHDIHRIASGLNCKFSWISRECNRVAHWVAKAHHRGILPVNWVSSQPSQLSNLCNFDLLTFES